MTDESVAKIIEMINHALDTPVSGLTAESKVLEIKGFDSLAMERLAVEFAGEQGGELSPLAFAQVETVRDLADLLGSSLKS